MKNYIAVLATPIEKHIVDRLIEKNHKEHDIFFDHGKHNHLPHVLLSEYALGADESRLRTEYERESEYLEPIPDFDTLITEDNWREFLCDRSANHAYARFWMDQIRSKGKIEAIKRLIQENLVPNLFGGAVHPAIHVGFGVEFDLETLLAEGLAMACCSEPILKDFNFGESTESPTVKVGMLQLFDRIRNDEALGPLMDYNEEDKKRVIIERFTDHVKKYTRMYEISDEPRDVVEALKELYLTSALLFGASSFPPTSQGTNIDFHNLKPDFFLMHVLTSILALRVLIPHLDVITARKLLQGHVATQIIYFIRAGRPSINTTALGSYPIPDEINSWPKMITYVLKSKDLHLAKVARACLLGSRLMTDLPETGQIDGLFRDKTLLERMKTDNPWFRVAALATDHKELQGKKWEFRGPGWSQTWSPEQ